MVSQLFDSLEIHLLNKDLFEKIFLVGLLFYTFILIHQIMYAYFTVKHHHADTDIFNNTLLSVKSVYRSAEPSTPWCKVEAVNVCLLCRKTYSLFIAAAMCSMAQTKDFFVYEGKQTIKSSLCDFIIIYFIFFSFSH
jgi:hypothetical protein